MILKAIPILILALGSLLITAPKPLEVAEPASPDQECVVGGPEYVGADSCKKCHFSQHKSWGKTEMAKAMDTLKPGNKVEAKKKFNLDPNKDYTKDASCLPCHTTGYGKPGGYPELVEGQTWTAEQQKRASLMEGVQCEACHGPGSLTNVYKKDHEDYKKADLVPMGLIEPDAANCATCHNTKSPTVPADHKFDYESLKKDPTKIHDHKKLKKAH
jgi:formate-dependent nitrite reductase cytochrome c552 subunit